MVGKKDSFCSRLIYSVIVMVLCLSMIPAMVSAEETQQDPTVSFFDEWFSFDLEDMFEYLLSNPLSSMSDDPDNETPQSDQEDPEYLETLDDEGSFPPCEDECEIENEITCNDNGDAVIVCRRDFDEDICLEWGKHHKCETGTICIDGECVEDNDIKFAVTKIVCEDEEDLPNWGYGGPDIDEDTATDYVASHEGCELSEGWYFQYAEPGTPNPGDNMGEATGWTTFGPTNENGFTGVAVPNPNSFPYLWAREVWSDDYLSFSGQGGDDFSAEFYCTDDVLNYDNYDKVVVGSTRPLVYHCVAFNVPVDEYIECYEDEECDDLDACTIDVCVNPGTVDSYCDYDDVVCDDDVMCTNDYCDSQLGCVYEPDDTNCDDSDVCTEDVCDEVLDCLYMTIPNDCDGLECGWSPTECYYCGDCELGYDCVEGFCELNCTDECSYEGELTCLDGLTVGLCGNYDLDQCLEWDPTVCPEDYYCEGGECIFDCEDECDVEGEITCLDYDTVRTCGYFDSDACLEYDLTECDDGYVCEGGECILDCDDECAYEGELTCIDGDTVGTCGYFDVDACLEYDLTECPEDYICDNGECVADCEDECLVEGETRCIDDDTFETCGDYDPDACLEWNDETDCDAGQVCEYGQCRDQNITCYGDSDCDDYVSCTLDLCVNPGTETSYCMSWPFNSLCNDGNVCTDEYCDMDLDCQYENNDNPCSDGNVCTQDDHCSQGECTYVDLLECDDDIACTDDYCHEAVGCMYEPESSLCDDGDACTVDICDESQGCVYPALANDCGDYECGMSASGCWFCGVCDAGYDCEDGYCELSCVDECDYEGQQSCVGNFTLGLCGDHDSDSCLEWDLTVCDYGDVCMDDACVNIGCEDDSDCDDGVSCTEDVCVDEGTPDSYCDNTPVDGHCEDNNTCTMDFCDPQLGCQFDTIPNDCNGLECGWSDSECYYCGDCEEGYSCVEGFCELGCVDECNSTGDVDCVDEYTIGVCGEYDGDPCLDYDLTVCPLDYVCLDGMCELDCSDECSIEGETTCLDDDTVKTCGYFDFDSCLEYDLTECPEDYICVGGECVADCEDECPYLGERICTDSMTIGICGDFDFDSCLEYDLTACPIDYYCSEGDCVFGCVDECEVEGELVCLDDDTIGTCGYFDSDECLEYDLTECPEDYTCEGGECVQDGCVDECDYEGQTQCVDDDTYEVCGDYDYDVCLEWDDETDCDYGQYCEGGACFDENITCTCDADCNDNDACSIDTCINPGTPDSYCDYDEVICEDGISCTEDSCDSQIGCEYVPDDALCDDGVACTGDTCDVQTGCQYDPVDALCDDGDVCTEDVCDAQTGCEYSDVANDCGDLECGDSPSGCYYCGDCEEGYNCVDGYCELGCVDECSYEGERQCLDNDTYGICGYFDSDMCLEWNDEIDCNLGEVCYLGYCEPSEGTPNVCCYETLYPMNSGSYQMRNYIYPEYEYAYAGDILHFSLKVGDYNVYAAENEQVQVIAECPTDTFIWDLGASSGTGAVLDSECPTYAMYYSGDFQIPDDMTGNCELSVLVTNPYGSVTLERLDDPLYENMDDILANPEIELVVSDPLSWSDLVVNEYNGADAYPITLEIDTIDDTEGQGVIGELSFAATNMHGVNFPEDIIHASKIRFSTFDDDPWTNMLDEGTPYTVPPTLNWVLIGQNISTNGYGYSEQFYFELWFSGYHYDIEYNGGDLYVDYQIY